VERNSGYYPHNVFLEAPMAMGIPMAIVFTTLIGFAVVKAWRALGSNADLLGLLFFQALLTATVAGALFGAIDLWIILVLLPSGGARTRIRQAGLRPQEGPVVHGSSG
jgi:O-antigen ligase